MFSPEVVEDIAPSVIPSKKPHDADSDISDIEAERYCDDASRSNVSMSMRLQVVKKESIKQLYRNTEEVIYN